MIALFSGWEAIIIKWEKDQWFAGERRILVKVGSFNVSERLYKDKDDWCDELSPWTYYVLVLSRRYNLKIITNNQANVHPNEVQKEHP